MKRLIVIFFVLFGINSFSQSGYYYLRDVDQAPRLPGCKYNAQNDHSCFIKQMNKYISDRVGLVFDQNNKPVTGKVKVFLVFEESGNLLVKTVRSSSKLLSENATAIFKDFLPFTPAVKGGKPVPMLMICPINFTTADISHRVFSVKEVSPPQKKRYKNDKSYDELKKLFDHSMYKDFFSSSKLKGHLVATDTYLYKFSFEIDTAGKVHDFKDLIRPGSEDEQYLNKKTLHHKGFLIPATLDDIPVRLRDTLKLVLKRRMMQQTEKTREVIVN